MYYNNKHIATYIKESTFAITRERALEIQEVEIEEELLKEYGFNLNEDTTIFKDYDIVLTTYGLVMNDIDLLSEYMFNYIILDESQAIKNPNSKRYKSIKLLKSKNKLVLTGTPIENNTFDLYAQMNFINPSLLGGLQQFKKDFATAIDKNKDYEVTTELKKLIDPFLLRRTKEKVAKDLLAKTEQFLYCTLGTQQRKVYDSYKNKYRDFLLNVIETDEFEKSKLHTLEELTKLRQICNSPSLLNGEEEYTNDSVKLDLLLNDISENTRNHKIQVFSFFSSMLKILKSHLEKMNIEHEYIDSSTKNRQDKVNNFQNNENIHVFLINLKVVRSRFKFNSCRLCIYF
ncbi:DEAD/DEAH box helicase [Flavicella sp.]|uniref:DEAD/DEAH box helicase n=1 Tax=Flavicella sp. TaxID=2957742 RepID=UPI0030184C5D